jgi:hypothetical protein
MPFPAFFLFSLCYLYLLGNVIFDSEFVCTESPVSIRKFLLALKPERNVEILVNRHLTVLSLSTVSNHMS